MPNVACVDFLTLGQNRSRRTHLPAVRKDPNLRALSNMLPHISIYPIFGIL
jgi:hypothetical protein